MEPVACTLDPEQMSRRLVEGRRLSADALIASRPTAAGYELEFHLDAEAEVRELIEAESRCCSFMTFNVERRPESLLVGVETPEAGRPVVSELFGLAHR